MRRIPTVPPDVHCFLHKEVAGSLWQAIDATPTQERYTLRPIVA